MVNDDIARVRALVGALDEPIVVLDSERRVVASNVGLPPGRRVGDVDDALVLFLGELETGREVVSLGRTVALPILEEVAHAYADRATNAEVKLVVTGGAEIELPLRPRMIRVVVENLVQNAIRYAGPESTCRVSVEQEGQIAVLAVADNGSGVRESELPRLFERFYRADQARTSRGTGLGLAIVKHVATSAGGTIEASSPPGRGLEIVCRFPL